ncbi:MAG: hypothetical protein H7039_08050 [Bryobacteraceae bacterium]|nr:hypothetical protein [Bryobacteraceae bacterium]
MVLNRCWFAVTSILLFPGLISAQEPKRFFVGGGPGMAILSAGSAATINSQTTAFSNYEPRLGALAHAFGGWHFSEYVTAQVAWSGNRNSLTFAATNSAADTYQQRRKSSQQNAGADALLYFRDRRSFVRPFLSVGFNYMWFRSEATSLAFSTAPTSAPPDFSDSVAGLRVAAGTDLLLRNGWGARYAFMEHLQTNVIGKRLSPRATNPLMNFQHLFGVVKYF